MKRFLLLCSLAVLLPVNSPGAPLNDLVLEERAPLDAVAIAPNDSTDLARVSRYIYVGGAGDVKVDMGRSGTVTLKAVPVGTMLHMAAKRVYNTGTTATFLIEFY